MSAELSLIIPFYNEEENVSAVIAEARTAVPGAEIIAVDDGSQDRTPSLLDQEKGIRVIHFPKNLGQGPALYAGLLASQELMARADLVCSAMARSFDSLSNDALQQNEPPLEAWLKSIGKLRRTSLA